MRFLGRDGRVSLDKCSHDASRGLQSERERSHVQEKQVLQRLGLIRSGQNGCLHRCAVRDRLVGIDGLAEFLSVEKFGKHRLNLWNSSGPADEYDLVDLSLREL